MGAEHSRYEDAEDDMPPETLKDRSIDAVAQYIKDSATNIVVLTGAGISTSAGIPDFRSPETGLYANLERLGLPYAEAVFDIAYFRNNPDPFYLLARELYPGRYTPTISHAFIALLSQKGKLRMLFTQNIDCLERAANIPPSLIIEAHGSFATQRCIECKVEYPKDLMMKAIENSKVPRCSKNTHPAKPDAKCNGLVKPDIVFFGEQLPAAFHANMHLPKTADLMLIIGTSLTVHPFAALPQYASHGVPRVLFNMEKVGGLGSRADDVCVLGPCDEGIRKLADALGWTDELETLWVGMGGSKDKSSLEVSTDLEDRIDQITKDVEKTTLDSPTSLEKHVQEKQQKGLGTDTSHEETSPKLGDTRTDSDGSENTASSSVSFEPIHEIGLQGNKQDKQLSPESVSSTSSEAKLQEQSNPPPATKEIVHEVESNEAAKDLLIPDREDKDIPKSSLKSNI